MPQQTEAAVKTRMARSSIRFMPKRSPSQPAAGMKTARLTRKPIATESREAVCSWNWRPMLGSATLTMVMSMMVMNMAATKTTLTAIFWLMANRGMSSFRRARPRFQRRPGVPDSPPVPVSRPGS